MEEKGKVLFIHAEGTRLGVSVRILFWPLSKSNVCCCDYMIFEKLGQMTPLTSARAHTRTHTNAHAHTNKTSLVACNPTRATFLFHHTRIIRRRRRHDVTHPWSGAVVVYSVCVCVSAAVLCSIRSSAALTGEQAAPARICGSLPDWIVHTATILFSSRGQTRLFSPSFIYALFVSVLRKRPFPRSTQGPGRVFHLQHRDNTPVFSDCACVVLRFFFYRKN